MLKAVAIILLGFLWSCAPHAKARGESIMLDPKWLDSIKRKADTSWTKPYRNAEFVTAEYYVDKKDSIVTQLMKDSAGTVRQVNIVKYDQVRLFFAEYYANGQIKARIPLDSAGRQSGAARYYYENGQVKSEGNFLHGFYTGEWKNYNEKGEWKSTDEYDEKGQLIQTRAKN